MPVERYRSVEEMPPPWRPPDDAGNLRAVAAMLALYRLLGPPFPRGVRRFRSLEEANAAAEPPAAASQPDSTR
ncbi:MAG: hypothetical protein HRF46_13930 [Acidobacteriota bacterium]|jgi:hypothetical protein